MAVQELTSEEVRSAHHPVQVWMVRIIWGLLVLVVLLLFAGTFAKDQIRDPIEDVVLESYKLNHPEARELSDEDVLFEATTHDEARILGATLLLERPILVIVLLILLVVNGILMIRYYLGAKSRGVWLNMEAYPEVKQLVKNLTARFGYEEAPGIFILTGGDMQTACMFGRHSYISIPVDTFEVCMEEKDLKGLSFLIAHELAHQKMGHRTLANTMLGLTLMVLFPLRYTLGNILTRSQEYGADRLAALAINSKNGGEMLAQTESSHYYQTVDMEQFVAEEVHKRGIWSVLDNALSGYPPYSWRIGAIVSGKQGELFWPRKVRQK